MPKQCSTPYGIRGSSTAASTMFPAVSIVCSTPYGIRGSSTSSAPLARIEASRAQRLTASEVRPPPIGRFPNSRWDSCSTPYGIRGSSTFRLGRIWRQQVVLNALRHQRFVHNQTNNYNAAAGGAQRLTASEVRPPLLNLFEAAAAVSCSTPYGIRGSSTIHLT